MTNSKKRAPEALVSNNRYKVNIPWHRQLGEDAEKGCIAAVTVLS